MSAVWGLEPVGAGFLSGSVGAGWGPGLVDADWGRRSVAGWLGLFSFLLGWRAAGVGSPFFGTLLLVLAKFLFWRGGWVLGYHSMVFGHFPYIS